MHLPTNVQGSLATPAAPVPDPANSKLILEQPSRTARKLRVVCIGAGFAGLILAHRVKYTWKMEDIIDLQIYEKNPDVGGTWYENRYPGVACDIPAHVYVFPFEPNPNWSGFYANGSEIWQYIKDTSVKWKLEQSVIFNAKITETVWHEESGKWRVTVDKQGELVNDECDVLVNASGFLNKWSWPAIEGLHDFKGKLLHTADWDTSYDWTDKKVAVIGNGSSAIQVVPQVQKSARSLVNYIRNPTWVVANFLNEFSEDGKLEYSEEKKKELRENPDKHFEMRKKIEHTFNQMFKSMVVGTPEQKAMEESYQKMMYDRLGNDPELIRSMVPEFKVGCRRLTPGEGYLEALREENARIEWSPIVKVTERGILTDKGEEEFDLIVTATGFDVSFRPSWKLEGRRGRSLEKDWLEEPKSYFGMCAADHPNYFIYCGPGSPLSHGVLMGSMDAMTGYILKWCRKIAAEDIKAVAPKAKVVDDLFVWSQELMKRTVWAGECRSWYKNGKVKGTIPALHAGSLIHYRECLEEVRGEDFEITYQSSNEFRFLGNGLTQRDANGEDLAYYMTR